MRALADFRAPVFLLLAGRDEIVTNPLGRKLQASLQCPNLLVEQPNAGHITLDLSPTAPWWRKSSEFLLDGSTDTSNPGVSRNSN